MLGKSSDHDMIKSTNCEALAHALKSQESAYQEHGTLADKIWKNISIPTTLDAKAYVNLSKSCTSRDL